VVERATEAYRIESDPLAQFIDECCVVGDDYSVGATEAYRAYEAWAGEQGMKNHEALSATKFGARMRARFERRHTKRGKRYAGLGLLSDREGDGFDDTPAAPDDAETSPDEPAVTGRVTGFESDDRETQESPPENPLTRKDPQKAVTTRHPSPPSGDPRCDICGRVMSASRVSTVCMYCKRAAD
jgi:phage/plasmid-associated DNA primase